MCGERIPTEDEWRSEPWTAQTPVAYKNFLGKSVFDAIDMFAEDPARYQADLLAMPGPCFLHYIHGLIEYLESPAADGDTMNLDAFLSVCRERESTVRSRNNGTYILKMVQKLRNSTRFPKAVQ